MGGDTNKVLLAVAGVPIVARAASALAKADEVDELIVVAAATEVEPLTRLMKGLDLAVTTRVVVGGAERADSVTHGVRATDERAEIVLIHDGARPFLSQRIIGDVIEAARRHGAAIPARPVIETLKRVDRGRVAETVDREGLFGAQTPQGFQRARLVAAIEARPADAPAADRRRVVARRDVRRGRRPRRGDEHQGHPSRRPAARRGDRPVDFVQGTDMTMERLRIGIGQDRHRLAAGRKLVLGGVLIPHDKGLVGHSDADVLLHAIADALLGAAGLDDIGTLFPDRDPRFAGADSSDLTTQVMAAVAEVGLAPISVDCVLTTDEPKIAPHRAAIRRSLAALLDLPEDAVNVKAKTTEGAGPDGTIDATAVALLAPSRTD